MVNVDELHDSITRGLSLVKQFDQYFEEADGLERDFYEIHDQYMVSQGSDNTVLLIEALNGLETVANKVTALFWKVTASLEAKGN